MSTSRLVSGMLQNVRYVHRYRNTPLYRHSEQQAFDFKGPNGYRIYPHKYFYKFLFRRRKKGGGPLFSKIPIGAPSISLQVATECSTATRVASSKRAQVLNKLYMRYIPEVLYTSELGEKLVEHGVEFSEVKILPDYSLIRVYWIPKIDADNEAIQKLLDEVAKPLRREMCILHLTGNVPPIRFLKDKYQEMMIEVDRRLKIADYGENFTPTIITNDVLKRELQLHTHLSTEIQERIAMLEKGKEIAEEEVMEEPLVMPAGNQDVFGLNRDMIINGINENKKRARKLIETSEESILGSSVIKAVPMFEVETVRNWSKKDVYNYIKKQAAKKKAHRKELENIQQTRAMEEAYEAAENVEDELYVEFVKNAFHDRLEDDKEPICDRNEL